MNHAAQTNALRTILVAGILAGFLDISFVFVYFHAPDPLNVLRGIAAGLLGPSARLGGLRAAAIGLGLHFVIAVGAAAFFYAISAVLPTMRRHPVRWGIVYGIGVWEFMNLAVLPLSANPPKALLGGTWMPVLVAHLICIGIPIALVTRKLAPAPSPIASEVIRCGAPHLVP
jgi:hypothetical protein